MSTSKKILSVSRIALLLMAAVGLARPSTAADETWEQLVVELASPTAATRVQAARRAAAAWPDGARVAPVLAAIAREDADPAVRAGALEAVASLSRRGLETWASFLTAAKGDTPRPFHHVAQNLHGIGARMRLEEYCLFLRTREEADQAAVLGALPRLWAARPIDSPELQGIDLILLDRAVHGGTSTRPLALAGLAICAGVSLADQGLHAQGSPSGATADTPTLVAALNDPRPYMPPLALALAGSAAVPAGSSMPDPVAAAVLQRLKALAASLGTSSGGSSDAHELRLAPCCVTAVSRLGPGAAGAAEDLRALQKRGIEGVWEALVRIGDTREPFPEDLAALTRLVQIDAQVVLKDAERLRSFLDAVDGVRRADPTRAQAAQPAVWAIARVGWGADAYGTERALRTLGGLGALDEAKSNELAAHALDLSGEIDYPALLALGQVGKDPRRAFAALLDARSRPDFKARVTPDQMRSVARVAVGQPGSKPATEFATYPVTSPIVRGALEGLCSAPARAAESAAWIAAMLSAASERTAPFRDGTLLKALPADAAQDSADGPLLLPAAEARRLAARALGVAGPAAAPHRTLLEGLRKDPDVVVRWRAEQALHTLGAR